MKSILLSYTAINDLYQSPHSWLNKQMGIKKDKTEAMQKGTEAHEILQAHVSGIKKLDIDLDLDFPKVEHHARKRWNDKFTLHGYCDGINFTSKVFLEIKTSGKKPWTNGQFERSMQPKYYSFVTGFRKAFLLTCLFNLSEMKTYYREFSDKEWKETEEWVAKAIDLIEHGDLKADLVDGKCQGWCPYRKNCYFL